MRILVLGDSCIDRFVTGDVKKINPEAPSLVFSPLNQVDNPGMAGNVYRCLQALADPGHQIDFITDRNTALKTRYVDKTSSYILFRTDENDHATTTGTCDTIPEYDIYLVSDYQKGFVDKALIQCLSKRPGKVFIDSKLVFGRWAEHVFCAKINSKEYQYNLSNGGDLNYLQNLVVTKGGEGADYYQFGGKRGSFPGHKVEVSSLSGCGDTHIAALVAEYLRTENLPKAIEYANRAAAIAASKPGVAVVTREELV